MVYQIFQYFPISDTVFTPINLACIPAKNVSRVLLTLTVRITQGILPLLQMLPDAPLFPVDAYTTPGTLSSIALFIKTAFRRSLCPQVGFLVSSFIYRSNPSSFRLPAACKCCVSTQGQLRADFFKCWLRSVSMLLPGNIFKNVAFFPSVFGSSYTGVMLKQRFLVLQ